MCITFQSLCLLLLSVFTSANALAETRYAMVIGNSAYSSTGMLANPKNDAVLMQGVLQRAGFDVDALFDLDEDKMGEAVDTLLDKVSQYDTVALYFAGHGLQKDGQNYLVPVDARISTSSAIERETISLDSFMRVLEKAKIGLLFLDACRNNPFAEKLAAKEKAAGRSITVGQSGLAAVRPAGDMLIAFATLPNAVASDGAGKNSPFARALAKHIPTPNVEISVMMKRVTADVYQATSGEQRPQQLSQMQREFYFGKTDSASRPTYVQAAAKTVPTLLAIYPDTASVGEEVAVIADVSPACTPTFYNVSASGKIQPIPVKYFKQIDLTKKQRRFEISPGSDFGLKVTQNDEKGRAALGFICENPTVTNDQRMTALRSVVSGISGASSLAEFVSNDVKSAVFHFMAYTVR